MSKLNPIYVALDSHQYNRAIKLASALPETNVLGKALLAHAYSKSGQRYMSLVVLNKILGGNFCELKHEVEYSLESVNERQQQQPSSASSNSHQQQSEQPPAASSSNKKGKKGKKKGGAQTKASSSAASAAAPSPGPATTVVDLIDQLNCPPKLPANWEVLPSADNALTDDTLLSTLAVTIQGLQLPLTAYQIYSWAATAEPTKENILTKTFGLGLNVLAAPSKFTKQDQIKISTHVLAHIQTIALQWSRLLINHHHQNPNDFPVLLATSWAAQTSLWQIQWLPDDPKRSMLLPRLAESMAQKILQHTTTTNTSAGGGDDPSQQQQQQPPAEVVLLCLRTLEQQSKWKEMLEILEKLPTTTLATTTTSSDNGVVDDNQQPIASTSEFGVTLTTYQILTEKARVLQHLQEYDQARNIYEKLLKSRPDDWSCWKGHLQCCVDSDHVDVTTNFVDEILEEQAGSKYPLRGPHLMKVELASYKVKTKQQQEETQSSSPPPEDVSTSLRELAGAIQSYGEMFAPRANCAFSDLDAYVEQLATTIGNTSNITTEVVESLLKFAETMLELNQSPTKNDTKITVNNKERQTKLRAYIFSVKLTFKLLVNHVELQRRWLPDWKELVTEWQESLTMSSSNEGEESQKELKPGDDLILLAVQQILYQQKSDNDVGCLVACAVLLESAISHSPDNSYLKIAAIDVYFQLDATSRSWEFYNSMSLKHIQCDSCTYTILPYLMQGGLYNETIDICKTILRFQAGTARDCGDYAGRAMEAGTLSKANEFMKFQRNKMIKSLSFLEAKGLILDAASLLATAVPSKKNDHDPILKGGIGILQGIVGGDDDIGRATQMVVEAYNPYAALSAVSWANTADGSIKDCEDLSDNRDMDILSTQILYRTKTADKQSVVADALRRGHIHGILIRASLCVNAAKGPKKGKVVKPTEDLTKRTQSLLDCVDVVTTFVDTHTVQRNDNEGVELGPCCGALVHAALHLCRALAMINAGLPKLDDDDTMERREQQAHKILDSQALVQMRSAKDTLSSLPALSVKDVCKLLPNYVVPLFAVYKMCSNICALYGWNKRKKNTKKVAGAMANIAEEFNLFVEIALTCLEKTLPASEEMTDQSKFDIKDDYLRLLDKTMLKDTTELIIDSQHRTRVRIEPVLQEMNDYLHSFNHEAEE